MVLYDDCSTMGEGSGCLFAFCFLYFLDFLCIFIFYFLRTLKLQVGSQVRSKNWYRNRELSRLFSIYGVQDIPVTLLYVLYRNRERSRVLFMNLLG